MAKLDNHPEVIDLPTKLSEVVERKVVFAANTDDIYPGDPLFIASGLVTFCDAVGNEDDFDGVSLDASVAAHRSDGDTIRVARKAVLRVKVTSAAYVEGQGLTWAQDGSMVAAGGGAICNAWSLDDTEGNNVTELRAEIDQAQHYALSVA